MKLEDDDQSACIAIYGIGWETGNSVLYLFRRLELTNVRPVQNY